MNVYVVVVFRSYGENAEIYGVYTSEKLANEQLAEFFDQSIAHSGYIEEQELIDLRT
jgi:hypothetical protein